MLCIRPIYSDEICEKEDGFLAPYPGTRASEYGVLQCLIANIR